MIFLLVGGLVVAVALAGLLIPWNGRNLRPAAGDTPTVPSPSARSSVAAADPPTGGSVTGSILTDRGCALPGQVLTVAAAPDIADPIRRFFGNSVVNGCRVLVTVQDPAQFVASWRGTPGPADVWIPDSSVWLALGTKEGIPVPADTASIAVSPVVFALSGAAARGLSATGPLNLYRILASRSTASPIRVGLPAPDRSVAAVAAVLEAESAVTD